MKKFIAILAVLAITGFSVVAFAADVTVGGSYEIRSRNFTGLNTLIWAEQWGGGRVYEIMACIMVGAAAFCLLARPRVSGESAKAALDLAFEITRQVQSAGVKVAPVES